MNHVRANIEEIRARMAAAIARRGGDRAVRLVAVSKRHPPELIEAAIEAGELDFAENYAQELRDKQDALRHHPHIRWHFIGPLQSNKAKLVVGTALIHTVDRPSLLEALDKRARAAGLTQDVLVQVNLAREPQKAGVDPDDLAALLDRFATFDALRCRGLMLIPPAEPPETTRAWFAALRGLRDRLAAVPRPGVTLDELSMGMSDDFECAIEEGATLVRIGTAIFGQRPV